MRIIRKSKAFNPTVCFRLPPPGKTNTPLRSFNRALKRLPPWHRKRKRFACVMHIKETGVAIITALDNMTGNARLISQRLGWQLTQ